MRIHVIAMGGAVMHNLSIALQLAGHQVTGSDDEIYNPAKDRLDAHGLLPEPGWYPDKLEASIDLVILGMHAKKDNPELARAQELKLRILSYPEFIALHAKNKRRVVVAGSHGKTTTTSMIMHVLKHLGSDYDYLVGAPLEGFDLMIRLSEAPLMVIEGDEYLSSAIDPVPKIIHYKPHLTIITGIAWDHINVFPTKEDYIEVFRNYLAQLPDQATVWYFQGDEDLCHIVDTCQRTDLVFQPYHTPDHEILDGAAMLVRNGKEYPMQVFGQHNMQNAEAALQVCLALGYRDTDVLSALTSFRGAARRLQALHISGQTRIYLDFAHAPSKVRATVQAIRTQYPGTRLVAILELHTFSSLNKNFLSQYRNTLEPADEAVIFYNKHTLEIKKMPALDPEEIKARFGRPDLLIFTENTELENYLNTIQRTQTVILFMSSGTFNGVDIKSWAQGQ